MKRRGILGDADLELAGRGGSGAAQQQTQARGEDGHEAAQVSQGFAPSGFVGGPQSNRPAPPWGDIRKRTGGRAGLRRTWNGPGALPGSMNPGK